MAAEHATIHWIAWSGDQDPYDRDEYVTATAEEALEMRRIIERRIPRDCHDTIQIEARAELRPLTYEEFLDLYDWDYDEKPEPPSGGPGGGAA